MQAFRTVSEARKYLKIGAAPRTGIALFSDSFAAASGAGRCGNGTAALKE